VAEAEHRAEMPARGRTPSAPSYLTNRWDLWFCGPGSLRVCSIGWTSFIAHTAGGGGTAFFEASPGPRKPTGGAAICMLRQAAGVGRQPGA